MLNHLLGVFGFDPEFTIQIKLGDLVESVLAVAIVLVICISIYKYIRRGNVADDRMADSETTENGYQQMKSAGPEGICKWKLNSFLQDLDNEMTPEDTKKLKNMFTGIIPKRKMEFTEKPFDIFRLMMEMQFLSEYNVVYLQAVLFKLGKLNLINMVIEYCRRTRDQVIEYCEPEYNDPAPGFKFVTFHCRETIKKQYQLDKVRNKIADILCIEPKHVNVVGIQKSNSTILTVMMPAIYVTVLEDLMKNEDLDEFSRFGLSILDTCNTKDSVVTDCHPKEVCLQKREKKTTTLTSDIHEAEGHVSLFKIWLDWNMDNFFDIRGKHVMSEREKTKISQELQRSKPFLTCLIVFLSIFVVMEICLFYLYGRCQR